MKGEDHFILADHGILIPSRAIPVTQTDSIESSPDISTDYTGSKATMSARGERQAWAGLFCYSPVFYSVESSRSEAYGRSGRITVAKATPDAQLDHLIAQDSIFQRQSQDLDKVTRTEPPEAHRENYWPAIKGGISYLDHMSCTSTRASKRLKTLFTPQLPALGQPRLLTGPSWLLSLSWRPHLSHEAAFMGIVG